MPMAPLRPCLEHGCPALVRDGWCDAHRKPTAKGWNNDETRIRGRELQRLRQELFQREPLCRVCKNVGRITVATIRDHITPLAEGGTDDSLNIQPLCQACSDAKTQQESLRGRTTGGYGYV